MPYVIADNQPVYWAVGDPIVAAGLTEMGGLTVSGLPMVSDTSENAYLGKVAGKAGTYKPLPASGWLEAEEIYAYGGGLVIVRQSHNRTAHAPADVPALFCVYRSGVTGALDWVAGEKVEKGARRKYAGIDWECIQPHVTQTDWTPDKTPALWKEAAPAAGDWKAGVSYKVNDLVTYGGKSYKCRQAHTSQVGWEPDKVPALWTVQ